jgi:hypothetical protein
MAIISTAGNASLEVNGKIDFTGVFNTGNLNGNASTIIFGSNAVDFGAANLTANKAFDFGIENLNGNAATISGNNANSLTEITVSTGASLTINGSISLKNGTQIILMPHSTIIAANGVTFSTGAETVIYTHSDSSRNNPLSYKNTCREENTLADYDYYNDDTDPSGVGMLVIGNTSNLVDPIEG